MAPPFTLRFLGAAGTVTGPDPRNTILCAGYQAGGTRGAAMVAGAKTVKIHGEYVPIDAEVIALDSLSSHADYAETMAWLGGFRSPPQTTFITHREPLAADCPRHRSEETLRWRCIVPEHGESFEFAAGLAAQCLTAQAAGGGE